MGRTTDITAGGVRIEYLKGRRALRLTAGDGDGPVEVPLSVLIERLDIDRRDFVPQPRLLLFAGRHDETRGGAGDLVGWFESDAAGRAAFRELRSTTSDGEGWAELVALDGGARPAVRAWFGRRGAERRDHPSVRRARGHLRLLAR